MSHAPHAAGTRYVVIPITGRRSATLVQPRSLPIGDHAVEQLLFRARVVQVVIDDVVAERIPCDRAALESSNRLPHRRREPLDRRLVRVALERRWQLQLVLDAVAAPPRSSPRTRGTGLTSPPGIRHSTRRAPPEPDDPEPARPVVEAPRERRRRPRARRVPLVRVDVGAKNTASSRAHAIWPARYCPNSTSSEPNAGEPSRHNDEWM